MNVQEDGNAVATVTAPTARASFSGVYKRFGATQALSDVSMRLMPGRIHGLVGENGAGKSTLVKILAGIHQPDVGTIGLDGETVSIHDPAASRAMGIAVVHQEPSLFPDLSVAENVYLGDPPRARFGGVDWGTMRQQARALLEDLDVGIDVTTEVRGLSLADQQLIDRQGARGRRPGAGDGRTHSVAIATRGRPSLHHRSPGPRQRRRGHVRQPPPR